MASRKSKLRKEILKLSVLTTLVVVLWIGFSVYFKLTKPTPPDVPQEVLRPLSPVFGEGILEKIKVRRFIKDEELEDISKKKVTLVEEEETEEATVSGTPESEATESASPEE